MDEPQIEEFKELKDCAVVKFPIVDFGSGSKISQLYDNVKLLVFATEPWKLVGTQAIAINEKIMYALVKCSYKSDASEREPEYLIMAEKRIGEFLARGSSFYVTPGGRKESIELKTLMLMQGEQLKNMVVRNPLVPTNDFIPTVVYNKVTSSYGTGLNPVIPGHDVESLKIASNYP